MPMSGGRGRGRARKLESNADKNPFGESQSHSKPLRNLRRSEFAAARLVRERPTSRMTASVVAARGVLGEPVVLLPSVGRIASDDVTYLVDSSVFARVGAQTDIPIATYLQMRRRALGDWNVWRDAMVRAEPDGLLRRLERLEGETRRAYSV